MTDPKTLARWLVASKEFVDRPGPYLSLELFDEQDEWVLRLDDPHYTGKFQPSSPHDLAKALLEFIQNP